MKEEEKEGEKAVEKVEVEKKVDEEEEEEEKKDGGG